MLRWEDDPLLIGELIKVLHIDEIRDSIDAVHNICLTDHATVYDPHNTTEDTPYNLTVQTDNEVNDFSPFYISDDADNLSTVLDTNLGSHEAGVLTTHLSGHDGGLNVTHCSTDYITHEGTHEASFETNLDSGVRASHYMYNFGSHYQTYETNDNRTYYGNDEYSENLTVNSTYVSYAYTGVEDPHHSVVDDPHNSFVYSNHFSNIHPSADLPVEGPNNAGADSSDLNGADYAVNSPYDYPFNPSGYSSVCDQVDASVYSTHEIGEYKGNNETACVDHFYTL